MLKLILVVNISEQSKCSKDTLLIYKYIDKSLFTDDDEDDDDDARRVDMDIMGIIRQCKPPLLLAQLSAPILPFPSFPW